MITSIETSKAQALAAFVTAKHEIDGLLAALQAASDDHFGLAPEAINWGHAGLAEHYQAKLRELADQVLHQGEYAK